MSDGSKIEWTDATWQPVTGCSVVSPGCTNCYAMRLAGTRLRDHPSRRGLTKMSKAGSVWTGEVRFNEQWLDQPLRWERPRKIFVCAHGDLFHENVPDEWIDRVFAVMALAHWHTFQVLTKRSAKMKSYMTDPKTPDRVLEAMYAMRGTSGPRGERLWPRDVEWPLPNVWAGTSCEEQPMADARIPHLLATPAAVYFISAEPLLGPIILPPGFLALGRRGWVIAGGESGRGARPSHPDWPRDLRDQCVPAGVPFHFKQHGEWIGIPDLRRLPNGSGPGFGVYDHCQHDMTAEAVRVGKKAAGRLLDGRTWDEFPGAPA